MNDDSTEQLLKQLFHQQTILNSLPYAVVIKDNSLTYRYANTQAVSMSGLNSASELYGRTDYELPWENQAKLFQQGGQDVLKGSQLTTLDPIVDSNGQIKTLLTQQTPIYDTSGKIIGINATSHIVSQQHLLAQSRRVPQHNFQPDIKPYTTATGEPLTPREQQCAYYLIRGFSAKNIAKKIGLSFRTVEHHLDNIRQKYNVSTKFELIQKINDTGSSAFIPEIILE